MNKQELLHEVSRTDVSKTIFRKISQNREYIKIFCNNDRKNPFNFECRKWFYQLN